MISNSVRRMRALRGPVGIAFGAALLALFFFTPRIAIWRGLEVPMARMYPEVNRATYALMQLHEPFVQIESPTNKAIQSRLFFPLLGYALRLPDRVYLMLPHLGCLLVLGFVARLLLDRGWSGWETVSAATLLATSAWFFVSTGWLAYFDSWYVLGMMLVSFARRRWLLVLAMLATPWVDERFVFALPIALLVRREFFRADSSWWGELKLSLLALLPWIFLRAGLAASAVETSSVDYVRLLWSKRESLIGRSHLQGAWHGLRWGWVLVAMGVLAGRQRWALGITAGLTLTAVFVVADDLSRATAVMVPIAIFGAVSRERWVGSRWELTTSKMMALAALNLVFPAKHVVARQEGPIFYLYREIERLDNPPPQVDPTALTHAAEEHASQGRAKRAHVFLDAALSIDADHVFARRTRAELHLREGNIAAAASDAMRGLGIAPNDPDLLWVSARVFLANGEFSHAVEALEAARAAAPATWAHGAAVAEELERIRARPAR